MKDNALPKITHAADNSMIQVARTLMAIMEQRDKLLKNHCVRVANNCANFCENYLSSGEQEVEAIYLAGVLHDIGLIFLPLTILKKPEALTEDENALVRTHPTVGENILSNLTGLNNILPIIRHHHEVFDGSGYPDGLKGQETPLGARILCLFDSYDSMTSPRAKTSGLSMQEALTEIKNKSAQQFDNNLINKFVQFIESTSGESEGWLEKKDKSSIKQIFKEILKNFKAGKIDAPVMPQIVKEVQSVIKQSMSNVDDVAGVVEKDPVLSLRLIAVANSPVYRGVQKIESLKHAIPRIGLKETHNIIVAISVKSLYETQRVQFRNLMDELWQHALACAHCAKLIARDLKLDDPEKFFLMGLIHDIGKTLLLKAFSDASQSETLNIDMVKANLQEAHLSLGAGLLKRWGFGEEFINVISHHVNSEFRPESEKEILVVNLANLLTRKIGYSSFDNESDSELAELESVKLLEIDSNSLDRIGEEIKIIIQELINLF
jgi:putative nucleotidyltransferase with HDIG domain